MRRLFILGITCMSLLFSACGKGDGASNSTSGSDNTAAGTDPNASPKSLFSVWNEQANTFQLDFRSAQFGVTSVVQITSNTVGSCTCDVLIQGSQTAGTMVFSNCSNGSIGCISLKPSGSYTKASASLQICSNTSCMNMK
jgi:hypothetical protein